ncbi:pol protein [Gossypium australe]|uniref:Pol protein n=1 Tax=Gossypium australe TaxID=47621 RepID=A0A5B6UV81_9ROSI|nr:pol protein [Gossypium australe]
MASYKALYERKYRTLVGTGFDQKTDKKVKVIIDRLKTAFDRQKSHADLKRKDIKYSVGQKVFLKVSPWKKVLRFGKKRKLSPRFIEPYEVLECVGPVAYRLALPPELARIHNVFHVSMLRRYRSNLSHAIALEAIEVQPELTYVEKPIKIFTREVKELRNKRIPSVKVLGRHCNMEEAT